MRLVYVARNLKFCSPSSVHDSTKMPYMQEEQESEPSAVGDNPDMFAEQESYIDEDIDEPYDSVGSQSELAATSQ
jgi:hypothetical protein